MSLRSAQRDASTRSSVSSHRVILCRSCSTSSGVKASVLALVQGYMVGADVVVLHSNISIYKTPVVLRSPYTPLLDF